MSVNQSEETNQFLQELSQITDSSQFLEGVQGNPDLVLSAIKELVNRSNEWSTAAAVLHSAHCELSDKNSQLLKTTADLETAQQKIKKLEKKISSSSLQSQSHIDGTLNKLSEVLNNLQVNLAGPIDNRDLDTFNGDKKKFSVWKEAILMKLKSNPQHFRTERSKMNLFYSKLSADCQAHLHSWITEGELTFPSLQSMLNLLEILFDDPNRVRDAKERLYGNKQRDKPFTTWIAEIRRDAAIAGYDKLAGPLRDIIFMNLSLELKQAIINDNDIDNLDLNQAIARLQDIDNKRRAFDAAAAKKRYRNPINSSVLTSNLPKEHLTTSQGGDAMDLSSASIRPHGPLSQEEKIRRRNLGLCIYCGRSGHVIRSCPLKPTRFHMAARVMHVEQEGEEKSENL